MRCKYIYICYKIVWNVKKKFDFVWKLLIKKEVSLECICICSKKFLILNVVFLIFVGIISGFNENFCFKGYNIYIFLETDFISKICNEIL